MLALPRGASVTSLFAQDSFCRQSGGRPARPSDRRDGGATSGNSGGRRYLESDFQFVAEFREFFQPGPSFWVAMFCALLNLTGVITHHAVVGVLRLPET